MRLDPGLARGLSYYTGAIIEIAVPDLAGSLGGGGRYDNLVGMFLGQAVPACGFSLGLERILVVMTERGMFPADVTASAADVLVTVWNAETVRGKPDARASNSAPRACASRCIPDADKIGKQLKYASSRHARYAVIAGDDESAKGRVTVKNLTSGEQSEVPRTNWPTGSASADRRLNFSSATGNPQPSIDNGKWQTNSAHSHARTPAASSVSSHVGQKAVLLGWVHRVRDLGGLLFLDVRDRDGVTQVVVPNDSAVMADAKRLRSEYVVAVLGPRRTAQSPTR